MKNDRSGSGIRRAASPLVVDAMSLASMLGVSLRHIRRLDSSGRIPSAVCIGRAKRWIIREIEAWVEAGSPDRCTWTTIRERGRTNHAT